MTAPDWPSQTRPGAAPSGQRQARRARLIAGAMSILAHAAILLAVLAVHQDAVKPAPVPIDVTLVDAVSLAPAPKPADAAPAAPVKAPPPRSAVRPPPPLPTPEYLPVQPAKAKVADNGLSQSQMAGAQNVGLGEGTGAGGAGGGRQCDMARRLQAALRADPLVRAAIVGAAGKATMVWDGDWVRSDGEDGKGLAAVREAILWEVGFAPVACRAQPMRGMVLIAVNDATRLAIGQGEWRWSDLLTPRREAQ